MFTDSLPTWKSRRSFQHEMISSFVPLPFRSLTSTQKSRTLSSLAETLDIYVACEKGSKYTARASKKCWAYDSTLWRPILPFIIKCY